MLFVSCETDVLRGEDTLGEAEKLISLDRLAESRLWFLSFLLFGVRSCMLFALCETVVRRGEETLGEADNS